MGAGIMSAALELIKEKERQGDKALDRLHDGMKTQMELNANRGSWTGDSKSPEKVVKEKVVEREKVKEPEEEPAERSDVPVPGATSEPESKEGNNISDMGIMELGMMAGK